MRPVSRRLPPRWPIGFHGALLPFVLVPLGFTLGRLPDVIAIEPGALVTFDTARLPYSRAALVFPVLVAVYYLLWKYVIAFLNDCFGA